MRCNHGRTVACTCNYLNQPLVRAEQTDLRWPGSHASGCPYVELKHEALELSGMLLLRTAYSDVQYSAYTFFSEAGLRFVQSKCEDEHEMPPCGESRGPQPCLDSAKPGKLTETRAPWGLLGCLGLQPLLLEATRHITEKDDYDHPQVRRPTQDPSSGRWNSPAAPVTSESSYVVDFHEGWVGNL